MLHQSIKDSKAASYKSSTAGIASYARSRLPSSQDLFYSSIGRPDAIWKIRRSKRWSTNHQWYSHGRRSNQQCCWCIFNPIWWKCEVYFGYVSDPHILLVLACERSCTRFRSILSDAWWHVGIFCECALEEVLEEKATAEAAAEYAVSNRENAFIRRVIQQIQTEQKQTHNLIVSVLSQDFIT